MQLDKLKSKKMSVGFYKNRLYTTDISSALKKNIKKKIRSPSIWFRTPKPVRIRQSGRIGNRGVTINESNKPDM